MSILDDYVVFEDNPSTPSKPKKSKNSIKKTHICENKTPINSVMELTIESFNKYFKDAKKVSKKDFGISYKGKKTLLGSLIKENDIFIEVSVINSEGILSNKFISIGFKFVAKREIKEVSKTYVILDEDRRIPLLVESKYMDMSEYSDYRDKIYEQFL